MTSDERNRKHDCDTATWLGRNREEGSLRVLILSPILLLAFFFGGARAWIWQGVAGLFFICLGAWIFRHGLPAPGKDLKRLAVVACALMLAPLLQTIALPAALLEILSPVRAQWSGALLQFGGISRTAISYDPLATLTHLAWWLFLAMLAVLLSLALNFRAGKIPTWFLHFLFALAGMQALYGIMQTLLPFVGVLWDTHAATGQAYRGYARGTFISRNHFAAFLGLIWPLLLAYLLILKSPRKTDHILGKREQALILLQKQALGIFCLALVILALVFSQSRGGILAALFSFTLLYLFAGLRRNQVAGVVAACGVIMLGYGAAIGFEGLANRFQQIEHGATGRMELWQDGWKAVLDHPLTGTGLGTYPEVGRAYQNAFGPGQRASHAHNDYLETAVELGLPAAGALIAGIWGLWCWRAARLWRVRKTMDSGRLLLAAASLAALGGYLLHGWVEFNNAIPVNQLTAVIIATFHLHISEQGIIKESEVKPLQSAV
ncbi:MAG: O-antigen ligase family protein [Desulfomicrobium sp.]|nr:O-antigen ligase family protein [Pseudomonadota bacterium]MBV1713661.1 O-antigen ligase family protein [Desulfomicrobium sp.]MBU4572197.1 O-antigen ligase family protein [Pseudomonadota bacterium]MBU4594175.1 O-antigen ligase family protein [Pseudomonadota bacterium]MBV1720874.1 O-antigen ligase family protein [Desulfomicrobium sp.]